MTKLLIAAFLLGHGAIHAAFLAPRPAATASGPSWPFELQRSWLLAGYGLDPEAIRIAGVALTAVTLAAFGLAALTVLGVLPTGLWFPTILLAAVASLTLLVLYFNPMLVLGIAIDVVLLGLTLVADWIPAEILP
jgi:hypothetical protein